MTLGAWWNETTKQLVMIDRGGRAALIVPQGKVAPAADRPDGLDRSPGGFRLTFGGRTRTFRTERAPVTPSVPAWRRLSLEETLRVTLGPRQSSLAAMPRPRLRIGAALTQAARVAGALERAAATLEQIFGELHGRNSRIRVSG